MAATPDKLLTTVVCSYGIAPLQLCLALDRIGQRLHLRFGGVVVCNGPHEIPAGHGDWQFLRGSNAELDFSAYQEGADHLQRAGQRARSVLFINDSTLTKHNAYRVLQALLAYRPALEGTDLPAIAGKTDAYDNVCFANPWSQLPVYVSSFCFLLNAPAIPVLQEVRRQAELDLGSTAADLGRPDWGTGLPAAFRTYLRTHLTHPGTSISWYQLTRHRDNAALLARKARCVYAEHRLSGEIGRQGVVFAVYPLWRMKARFFLFEQMAKLARRLRLSP